MPTIRRPRLDQIRGVAIVAMIAYHFAWNISHLGLVTWDLLGDPLWLIARTAILAAFLGIAGVAQGLKGPAYDARYQRRLVMLAGAAALVTAGSYIVFPDAFIWFGVLHCLLIASLIARPLSGMTPIVSLGIGLLSFALPTLIATSAMNPPAFAWIGLGTIPPLTNDWVPLFPFFGFVAVGVAIGVGISQSPNRLDKILGPRREAPLRGASGWLAWAGRHSLPIYLIHQPVLFGSLWLAVSAGLLSPTATDTAFERSRFQADCVGGCLVEGADQSVCQSMCACMTDKLSDDQLLRVNQTGIEPADMTAIDTYIGECQRETGLVPGG